MNLVVMSAALFGGAVLNQALPVWVSMGRAEPPIILSVALYYALNHSRRLMFVASVAGGVICDSINGLPLGASVACFFVIGAVAHKHRKAVFSGKWITHMFFGGLAGLIYTFMLYVLLFYKETGVQEASLIWVVAKLAGVCLLGAVVAPPVFRALRGMDEMVGNIPVSESK